MVDIVQGNKYQEINNYGITLRRLGQDDLELVRNWRNDPKIVRYMNFKEYITPEMQKLWFSGVDNINNFYYIIIKDGLKIGLVNLKEIDYENKVMEAGIFIYDDEYLNTLTPFQVALTQYDFGFITLGLEVCICHILGSNSNAIKFNQFLGYNLSKGEEGKEYQLYILKKNNYLGRRIQIQEIFEKLLKEDRLE